MDNEFVGQEWERIRRNGVALNDRVRALPWSVYDLMTIAFLLPSPSTIRQGVRHGSVRLACILSLALMLSVGSGCDAPESTPEPARPTNLILISIDTLRADRLGSYGYDRPTSPAIDSLAERGVRFSRAVAETSWTLPSHMTLMTGLHPGSHRVTRPKRELDPAIPMLAEILQSEGYRNFAVTGGGMVSRTFGFGRGFEDYQTEKRLRFGRGIERAEKWIDGLSSDEPYFLFLHTFAVHAPYGERSDHRERFETRPEEDHLDTRTSNNTFNKMGLRPGQFRFLSDRYDAGLRTADDRLGAFFAWLDKRDAFADTVVVLLSDHGEQFGEHGRVGHGVSLFMEMLHIPLIIVAPGVAPSVVDQRVGLIDVMPTVLDLLGVSPPALQGQTLVPLLTRTDDGTALRPVFSQLERHGGLGSGNFVTLRSVVEGRYHLITWSDHATDVRLFDLLKDPTESLPLESADLTQRLQSLIAQHTSSLPELAGVNEVEVPDDVAERLRALGYVDGEDPE